MSDELARGVAQLMQAAEGHLVVVANGDFEAGSAAGPGVPHDEAYQWRVLQEVIGEVSVEGWAMVDAERIVTVVAKTPPQLSDLQRFKLAVHALLKPDSADPLARLSQFSTVEHRKEAKELFQAQAGAAKRGDGAGVEIASRGIARLLGSDVLEGMLHAVETQRRGEANPSLVGYQALFRVSIMDCEARPMAAFWQGIQLADTTSAATRAAIAWAGAAGDGPTSVHTALTIMNATSCAALALQKDFNSDLAAVAAHRAVLQFAAQCAEVFAPTAPQPWHARRHEETADAQAFFEAIDSLEPPPACGSSEAIAAAKAAHGAALQRAFDAEPELLASAGAEKLSNEWGLSTGIVSEERAQELLEQAFSGRCDRPPWALPQHPFVPEMLQRSFGTEGITSDSEVAASWSARARRHAILGMKRGPYFAYEWAGCASDDELRRRGIPSETPEHRVDLQRAATEKVNGRAKREAPTPSAFLGLLQPYYHPLRPRCDTDGGDEGIAYTQRGLGDVLRLLNFVDNALHDVTKIAAYCAAYEPRRPATPAERLLQAWAIQASWPYVSALYGHSHWEVQSPTYRDTARHTTRFGPCPDSWEGALQGLYRCTPYGQQAAIHPGLLAPFCFNPTRPAPPVPSADGRNLEQYYDLDSAQVAGGDAHLAVGERSVHQYGVVVRRSGWPMRDRMAGVFDGDEHYSQAVVAPLALRLIVLAAGPHRPFASIVRAADCLRHGTMCALSRLPPMGRDCNPARCSPPATNVHIDAGDHFAHLRRVAGLYVSPTGLITETWTAPPALSPVCESFGTVHTLRYGFHTVRPGGDRDDPRDDDGYELWYVPLGIYSAVLAKRSAASDEPGSEEPGYVPHGAQLFFRPYLAKVRGDRAHVPWVARNPDDFEWHAEGFSYYATTTTGPQHKFIARDLVGVAVRLCEPSSRMYDDAWRELFLSCEGAGVRPSGAEGIDAGDEDGAVFDAVIAAYAAAQTQQVTRTPTAADGANGTTVGSADGHDHRIARIDEFVLDGAVAYRRFADAEAAALCFLRVFHNMCRMWEAAGAALPPRYVERWPLLRCMAAHARRTVPEHEHLGLEPLAREFPAVRLLLDRALWFLDRPTACTSFSMATLELNERFALGAATWCGLGWPSTLHEHQAMIRAKGGEATARLLHVPAERMLERLAEPLLERRHFHLLKSFLRDPTDETFQVARLALVAESVAAMEERRQKEAAKAAKSRRDREKQAQKQAKADAEAAAEKARRDALAAQAAAAEEKNRKETKILAMCDKAQRARLRELFQRWKSWRKLRESRARRAVLDREREERAAAEAAAVAERDAQLARADNEAPEGQPLGLPGFVSPREATGSKKAIEREAIRHHAAEKQAAKAKQDEHEHEQLEALQRAWEIGGS